MTHRFSLLCGYTGRNDDEEREVHALSAALASAGAHPGWPVTPRDPRFVGRRGGRRQSDTREILHLLGWDEAWSMSTSPAPVIAAALLRERDAQHERQLRELAAEIERLRGEP